MTETSTKCPFCDVDVTTNRILYKNTAFFVMDNIKPIVGGHLLIIPYRHIRMEVDILSEEFPFYRMAIRWTDRYIQDRFFKDVFSFINAPSGQSVPHFHKHMMPNSFPMHGVDTALREYLVEYLKADEP